LALAGVGAVVHLLLRRQVRLVGAVLEELQLSYIQDKAEKLILYLLDQPEQALLEQQGVMVVIQPLQTAQLKLQLMVGQEHP
jgi:hypothetical protein